MTRYLNFNDTFVNRLSRRGMSFRVVSPAFSRQYSTSSKKRRAPSLVRKQISSILIKLRMT